MCVMGEWSVGQWIVGVISFKKIYGLYGLKHHIAEKSGDVTDAGRTDEQTNKRRRQTREDRATQPFIYNTQKSATIFFGLLPEIHSFWQ